MEKTKFAHFIADTVSAAAGEGAFDRLVLVAPSHCLREIEDRLDAPTAAMVTGTLVKDLVKTPDYELAPHLREWIGPPGRAPL
jgi:protein required for attachment to host cells